MASVHCLGHFSRRLLLTPSPFASLATLTTSIFNNPSRLIFTSSCLISQKKLVSSSTRSSTIFVSSNYKTRIRIPCISMSMSLATTTSSVNGKDVVHPKLISDHEIKKVVAAKHSSWIHNYLPKQILPYAKLARLDKPIGTWLFLFPFSWSATLAASSGNLADLKTLALFACAAPLLRGAGCTINDFFDRDFDKMVERTKQRTIASGAVTPFQGICFFGFQMLLSHAILQLTNYSPLYEGSFIFLISTYPLMKRLTYWAQAYLGLVMNWGVLFGWYAIQGSLQPSIVYPLFMSGFFWTLLYDTIYAHQDKEDDIKVGVKSTALKFGDSTKDWTSGFAIACIGGLALTGYNAALGWPYYVFLAAASTQLAWQIGTANLSSPADCSRKFVSNKWFGALILSGMLLGRVFP